MHPVFVALRVVADYVFLGDVDRSYEGTACFLWSHSRPLDKKTRDKRRASVFQACSLFRIVISAFCQAFAYKSSCNKIVDASKTFKPPVSSYHLQHGLNRIA